MLHAGFFLPIFKKIPGACKIPLPRLLHSKKTPIKFEGKPTIMKNQVILLVFCCALLLQFNVYGQNRGNIGIGTISPTARMQVNHRSTPQSPTFLMLDSLTGGGPSMRFQRLGLDSFFTFSAGFSGPPSQRGMILSWIDDSLLWVKSNGRMGLGTGDPQARMQVNHRSTPQSPTFLMLDSISGGGPSMRFQRLGLDSFFTFSAGFSGPPSQRGMILSWIDDSLLWVKSNGRMGLGTGEPQARMQVNHRSTPQSPTFLMLDSISGGGPSMRFQRLGLDSFFTFSAGFSGPPSQRGMILSWIDDSLLWVKSNGRMGLGTGEPQARMQVNHRSTPQSPTFLMLDSLTGGGPSMRFQRLGLDSFFTFSAGFDGPPSQRGMILSWIDDSLLWVKSDGRMGLGTGNPLGRMQVNHKSSPLFPHFIMLDSAGGSGGMLSFRKQGVLKDLKMTGIPGATRAEMKFTLDSLLSFTNNRMGIFTEDPQHEIDLNGTVNIGKNLLLAGNGGQAGQVLRSNGSAAAPTWQDPPGIDIDTIAFNAASGSITLGAGSSAVISSTTEKYDLGSVHNTGTGISTFSQGGIFLFTARCSFTTESIETGPYMLKVILEILNTGSNVVVETIEQSTVLPSGMTTHTSQVQLHSQVKLEAGQRVRVRVANTKPTGSGTMNVKLDEFSGVLL
jgi:hypothetical protein